MPLPPTVPAQLDDVARLLADPARLRMLWALGDGRAYTAGELARVAELSPSAASNHLTRLVDTGLVEVRSQGRHRYFTVTREDVGRAVEALAAVTLGPAVPASGLPRVRQAMRYARRCYGHLAGECGVALRDRLVAMGALVPGEASWQLGEAAGAACEVIGVDAASIAQRDPLRPCLDWTERRWHLGGALGRAVLGALQTRGVLAPSPAGDRVMLVDPPRWQALLRALDASPARSTRSG